ncbi:MAG: hypothetical protein QXX57_03490 [Nitrososphaerota archaeon]
MKHALSKDGRITVYNTDLRLFGYVKHILSSLKIETKGPQLKAKHGTPLTDPRNRKTYYAKKDAYYLYAPSNYQLTFYKQIGFTIRRKQKRLEDYLTRRGLMRPPAKHSPIFS